MKILHFSPLYLPSLGGVQIVAHSLILQQIQAGHEAAVLTNHEYAQALKGRLSYPVYSLHKRSISNAHRLEALMRTWGRRYIAWQIRKLHQAWPFDVLHVHMAFPAGYFASLAARSLPNVRSVVTCHGIDIQSLPEIGYGFRLDPKCARRIATGLAAYHWVTIVGQNMWEDLEQLSYHKANVIHIPNGADLEKIRTQSFDRKEIYRQYGIPQSSHLLICVGRNHPKKGYRYIPGIAQALLQKRKDFIFAVIGKGTDELLEAAKQLGVESYLRLITEIPAVSGNPDPHDHFSVPSTKLISLLKSSDVFVFPTLLEATTPLAVIEAMAAGLPVVTTDAPGVAESIKEGFNGHITPVKDVKEMAEKIDRLLAEPEKRKRMSENCLKTAQQLSWKNISQRYEEIYRS